jgi:hypothetical protein
MKVRNTLVIEVNGTCKIAVETIDESGNVVHVGSRGIPSELIKDEEYLAAMAIVTAKESVIGQTKIAAEGKVISEIEV